MVPRPSFPPSLPAARTIPPKPLGEEEPPPENHENTSPLPDPLPAHLTACAFPRAALFYQALHP
ncbi:MAG: hypothetical protein IJT04_07165 [Bacteroidales bacterium]|nr:hypothetical protein [Bacteroidales bacterium]